MKVFSVCLLLALNMLAARTAVADVYSIATVGDPARNAVVQFDQELQSLSLAIELNDLTGIGRASELIGLLESGAIDLAVVPFEAIPTLSNSPILEPFLSIDAAGVRQAIDSQVGAFDRAQLERSNKLRVIDFWHVSSSIPGSVSPIEQVSALQGRKVAVPFAQDTELLATLGASTVAMPSGEIVTALERGALDSAPVPYDESARVFGFAQVVNNYVDRLYKPRVYAVIITEDRWSNIDYPEQYHLAQTAQKVGESLSVALDNDAAAFKQSELLRGASFADWNAEDLNQVQVASLRNAGASALDQELVRLAYDAASAPSSSPDLDPDEPRPANEVEIYFATDRIPVSLQNPETAYSSARILSGLEFGTAKLKLEDGRELGDDLDDVVEISSIQNLNRATFEQGLRSNDNRQIVLFIHGYNNAFPDALKRGATIGTDIAPDAMIISYTWPSDGALLSYGYVESSTDIADQNFSLLMQLLTDNVSPDRISIIAHSMGSRLLTNYIAGLPVRSVFPDEIKFSDLVFAAADISQQFFMQKQETPPNPMYPLSAYSERVTVYSSEYDRPLGLSQKLHGDQRLGLSAQDTMYLADGIVAVDASKIDPARWYQRFSFATRHSYVFDKASGVQELRLLLAGVEPSSRPGMIESIRDGQSNWFYRPKLSSLYFGGRTRVL